MIERLRTQVRLRARERKRARTMDGSTMRVISVVATTLSCVHAAPHHHHSAHASTLTHTHTHTHIHEHTATAPGRRTCSMLSNRSLFSPPAAVSISLKYLRRAGDVKCRNIYTRTRTTLAQHKYTTRALLNAHTINARANTHTHTRTHTRTHTHTTFSNCAAHSGGCETPTLFTRTPTSRPASSPAMRL